MEACSGETAPIISILYWPSLAIPLPFVCNFSNPFSRAFGLAKSALVTQYGKYGNGKLLL